MNEGKKPIKFSIGYQLQEEENEESFVDIAGDFKDHIGEIYFPWANMPSGRAPLLDRGGYVAWDGQQKLENDLAAFRSMGIKLNLLFNANCYGKYALSQYLRNRVVSVLDYLQDKVGGVDIVTTSSLTIAGVIKKYAPAVDVRASVNMRIGTPRGMEYVSGVFDSYYVQREYNRNMEHLKMLRKWADARGKKLYLLVNSGCLNFCSGQTFHDNAVAHEQEIAETMNIAGMHSHICWDYYKNPENLHNFLSGSWIRPEDINNYAGFFDVLKLATRMHSRPRLVIESYIKRKYTGNLPDLFEPSFSHVFAPHIIDNGRFPSDWFEKTSTCGQNCETCNYCREVLRKVAVKP